MQAHQQMDCGTFVLESEGIRWTDDLGSDDYNLPGFWDYKPNGQRWKYFRNNNLSHNTISIDHQIQYAAGEAFVCEEKADIAQPYAKLDMTSLYKDQAESVFRTFTLIDDQTVEVTDEIKLTNAQSTVSWSVITKADVETDGKTAHLTLNGKHFYMQIISPTNATFTSRLAQNTSPKEYPIRNTTIIEANCTFGQPNATIKIRMSSRPFLEIAHGPYLQEVTTNGATFAYQTSNPSFRSSNSRKRRGTVQQLFRLKTRIETGRCNILCHQSRRITTQHDLPIPHTCQRNQIIPTVQGGIRRQHRFTLVHIPYH